jgi:hypothetical protein
MEAAMIVVKRVLLVPADLSRGALERGLLMARQATNHPAEARRPAVRARHPQKCATIELGLSWTSADQTTPDTDES